MPEKTPIAPRPCPVEGGNSTEAHRAGTSGPGATRSELESLLERSAGTDVPVLLRAKEEAKRLVKGDPSQANLAALDRASKMLRDAMSATEQNENFQDVKAVLAFLQAEGRKIKQAKLYRDIKSGYLKRQLDMSFRRSDVDRYLSTLPLISAPDRVTEDLSALAREEQELKNRKLREQSETLAFNRAVAQGKYILRSDMELELAGRAMALSVGLRSVFTLYAPDYASLVDGDPNKAELMVREFEKNLDAALNDFSRPIDFRVELTDLGLEVDSGTETTDETGEGDAETENSEA